MSIRKGDYAIAGASVGFIGKPVWSRAETIAALPFTAPKDGVLLLYIGDSNKNGTRTFQINGVELGGFATNATGKGTVTLPINQGDILTTDASIWGTYKFVPFEYSGVSGINVITPEYIRNQNILSDYEAVTLSTSTTIMQYDGFLSITGERNDCAVYVNSVLAGYGIYKGPVNPTFAFTVPVKKGDSVYTSANAPEVKARFYKLRDYSGR